MTINKIIVHELNKEPGTADVSLTTSDQLIPVDRDSTDLITALLGSYRNDKILNAQFDREPGKYFPERFFNYRETSRNDEEFIQFTIDVIGNLVTIIRRKVAAKGGYIVFCEYNSNGTNFIGIFLIRDVEGKILRRVGTTYSIGRIEYLDTNHLAMACRINEGLLDSEQNYLTFTRLRQQEVSDYFTDWICVLQLMSSAEFTNALYNIINQLDLPVNTETGEEYNIVRVREMVYEAAKSSTRREVNISSLSELIYGNANMIRDYADEHNISIDTEFRYDKRTLSKFIQLNINKDGIRLRFSRGDLGTKVRASEDDPNYVIIESPRLAEVIRAEQS